MNRRELCLSHQTVATIPHRQFCLAWAGSSYASLLQIVLCLLLLNGCAYRFTNLHSKPPKGIQSIAFESVYDTSQKVRPHEFLWESLQRAFAANGKLRVTSVKNADALMQAEITGASAAQSKPINTGEGVEYDPKSPALPSSYKKLGQAAVLADNENQTLSIKIKVWHLRTKKLLFTKSYSIGSGAYRLLDNTTTTDNQYLRAEEAFQNSFQKMSNRLANLVVNDLLRSR